MQTSLYLQLPGVTGLGLLAPQNCFNCLTLYLLWAYYDGNSVSQTRVDDFKVNKVASGQERDNVNIYFISMTRRLWDRQRH